MELKAEPFVLPQNLSERRFWIGLACVALLHVTFAVGLGRSAPRQLGERDGSPDAISVDFVDPSALSASAQPPPAAPPAPVAQASPPATAAPPPAAQSTAAPPPSPPHADAPAPSLTPPSPEDLRTASLPPREAHTGKDATAGKETSAPPPVTAPAPAAVPKAATPPPAPAPKLQPNPQLSLQLDLPNTFAAPSGLSTAAVRPPDITRSGENDEFGRRVIRALRQTMPPARGELGRVTVRLLLSATGDLSELQLVRPAADPLLTQSVVFAVKQSSFPIPPKGATRSDRTFLVTYIYN
jgi:TonB family protein